MNRPDKAGEQSMEEILASIRQIIADEPSADRSAQAVEPNPLVPKSSASGASVASPAPQDVRAPALLDRLNGVLRNGTLPPTSPLGSKRPLSFDQDLADMFDEQDGAANGSVVAPKPAEIRVPDGSLGGMAKSPEAKPDAKDGSDSVTSNGASSLSSAQPPLSQPFLPPLPFGTSDAQAANEETPSPPAPPPPRNFGFPPLRKQGFYPPQNATPKLPPLPQDGVATTAAAPPSESANDKLKRLSGLGAVVPGDIGSGSTSTTASNSFGVSAGPLRDSGTLNDERVPSHSREDERAGWPASETPVSMPTLETPAPFRSTAFDAMSDAAPLMNGRSQTSAPFFVTDNVSDAIVETIVPEVEARIGAAVNPNIKPVEQNPIGMAPSVAGKPFVDDRPFVDGRFVDRPFAGAQAGFSPSAVQDHAPRFAAQPADTSAVAAQALDALAQGLAASAAASAMTGVTPQVQAAIPLITPIVEPSAASPHHFNALTTQAGGAVPAGRTLEDAVADMLRPMLQQWVADNMPRIIEKALRNEVTKSIKPGSK